VALGALEPEVRAADIVIFESTPALLLFERFRELNPAARFVYRVSDDLRILAPHPLVLEVEREIAPLFELVSSSSPTIHRRFAHLPNARVDSHGIDKRLFDTPSPSPYAGPLNALFLGFWTVDADFLTTATEAFPDVAFHFVGRHPGVSADNVVVHGELPFEETVRFVQHASFGLHTVAFRPAADALADSLKVVQFSYCGLPIVAPSFLDAGRPNVVGYEPGDAESARAAVERALSLGRMPELRREIPSWEDVALALAS
jgi:2-beta-glucuronyltransferase